ncbi:MAG: glycosyltransferase [Magnetococcus sp. DMHC-8]
MSTSDQDELSHFLDTVIATDDGGDVNALVHCFGARPWQHGEMLVLLRHLLGRVRLRAAFVLATLMTGGGQQDALLSLALSFGGFFYDKPEQEARGLALLPAQMDALSAKERLVLLETIIHPIMRALIRSTPSPTHAQLFRLLAICQGAIPAFRTLFDWEATAPALTLATLQQQGREQARLITLPAPAVDAPRPRRRVVIFMKDNYLARRILASMTAHGWSAAFHGKPDWIVDLPVDGRIVLELCRQQAAELLIMDFSQVVHLLEKGICQLLAALKHEQPAMKVVLLTCDAWALRKGLVDGEPDGPHTPLYQTMLAMVDAIWTSDSPSLSSWDEPLFAGKVLHAHLPHAGHLGQPDRPLLPRMQFIGTALDGMLWSRPFWLLAAARLGLPIVQQDHLFAHDPRQMQGSSALESYRQHMQRLQEATCCLHFTRKRDMHSVIVTHRSFEAPLMGALLVQEHAPDMHRFFIPGEHYLEFRSVAELAAIARFITERPAEAEEIRRCGNAFARQHYNDAKLLGYLEKFLWP